MPELDERLGAWRDAWLRRGGVAAWQADELEDHLRCAWSAARTRGATDDEAWNLALRALGPLDQVHHEYTLETAMTLTTKLFGLALTVALLLAVTITGPGGVSPFLHVPSLVFVALLVGCGLLLGFGGARVQRALRASVLASTPLEPDEVDALRPVLVRGHRRAQVAA
ncbi:MAG: hypothetical protein H6828_02225 [Planctomycetes bacterium]|nr:hypothetical protein [Planctomycetota bacterium]